MRVEINLKNIGSEVAANIQNAIENSLYFGLTNGRTVSLFDPKGLQQIWFGKTRMHTSRETAFDYPDMEKFVDAVKLALLSQREFIQGGMIIGYCQTKGIALPKVLGY